MSSLVIALIAAAAAIPTTQPALLRADGSVLNWSLDRQGGQGKQGVLVLAQGSGCLPAEKSSAIQAAKGLLPEFAVVTVEKHGVSQADAPADPVSGCSADFYANHTITARSADYVQVLETVRKAPWFDGRVVLFGGSEGGATVAQAAEAVKPDAVVVYSSGIGQPLRVMFKQVVPPPVAAMADAEFAKALAEPTSAKVWGGNAYRWWADAVDRAYVLDLMKTKVPVLLVQGGRDQSAPVASGRAARDAYVAQGRSELTYLEFPDYDHHMRDAGGASHQAEVFGQITTWLRARLAAR
ncbi:alpha/beta hydrolase family protein [Caulobacter sp. NIBR2454]|uniref:alpha/beta hydrolase family protein n=1 Tax=Caulobacter sp. NIBR2454 TaxID=3015996 RepID=UPI0022B6E54C|nr:prolyl oligopeptidase family serine peptidase [Caulobacter sp. NIBR2454]